MKSIILAVSVLCASGAVLMLGEPAHAAQVALMCSVVDVATFDNRVHIHCKMPISCSLSPGSCGTTVLTYVAVEINSPMASNVIQVALAAFINKRVLDVFVDDNPGANPAGCNQNDCRRLIGVVIR